MPFQLLHHPLSTRNQVNYQDDQSCEQKEVDEPSRGIGSDHTQQPEDAQNDENCPKHCLLQSHKRPVMRVLVAHQESVSDFSWMLHGIPPALKCLFTWVQLLIYFAGAAARFCVGSTSFS